MIPLYIYPSGSGLTAWNKVIADRETHPNVPVAVIADDSNGAGATPDPNYGTVVRSEQAAGATILMYVHSSYDKGGTGFTQTLATVEREIANQNSWYHPNGIFIDEMANGTKCEYNSYAPATPPPGYDPCAAYYTALTGYAHGLGLAYVVGNPGTDTTANLAASVDNVVFYENAGLPTPAYLSSSFHTSYPPAKWSFIAHGVATFDASSVLADAAYVKWLYVTDNANSNPYNTLPSYYDSEVSALSTFDPP